jgi:ribosome biogenesis GTPase
MGKSTLVNCLAPGADLQTQAISRALSSGRHTTTFSRMFEASGLPGQNARIIDSPGFQLFGLAHLSASQLMHALPDLATHLGHCRFGNCLHRDEPGCAVGAAVAAGQFDARRHELYKALLPETLARGA